MSKTNDEAKTGSGFEGPENGVSGEMIFTGPDYLRQHRVTVQSDYHFVGEGNMSPEGTSDLCYLWRAHPTTPHPRPRSTHIGEIGWSLPDLNDVNCSNNAIRDIAHHHPAENCFTEEYQSPRGPHPFRYGEACRTPCSAFRRPMVRVNSTPASIGAAYPPANENGCGWYSVPNSSYVPFEPEPVNIGVNNSFGGTKSPFPEY